MVVDRIWAECSGANEAREPGLYQELLHVHKGEDNACLNQIDMDCESPFSSTCRTVLIIVTLEAIVRSLPIPSLPGEEPEFRNCAESSLRTLGASPLGSLATYTDSS